MKYYKIHFTLSTKIRGNSDYIKDYKLKIPPVGKFYWEIPEFIGNVYNEKIDFEPYLLDIELFANAKVNDLIMQGGPVSGNLMMSGKLKAILEKYRKTGLQFFNVNIIKKNEIFTNYWLLNMYEFNQDYIDFPNSVIIHRLKKAGGGTEAKEIKIESLEEFNNQLKIAKEKLEVITIEKLVVEDDTNEDFFALKYVSGGIGYYVSENLKKEIEQAGCTGIEFQPSYLSLNEWLHNEREKVYGKV